MKILILGSTGMLGSMVFDYFSSHSNHVVSASERTKKNNSEFFDVISFLNNPEDGKFLKKYDYIINCIGIIKPHCKDDDENGVKTAIQVNSLFPHKLSNFLEGSKTKIIQIATDCVYSGKIGRYNEDSFHDATDVYGKSKSLGEVRSKNLLNIRCSIIGPEIKGHLSLLDWFLSQKENSELMGFSHHKWNGITTLQFAKICEQIIENNLFNKLLKVNHTHHYLPNKTVNKYELLKIFTKIFNKKYKIKKIDNVGEPVDRTIDTKYHLLEPKNEIKMETAILELKNYMDNK